MVNWKDKCGCNPHGYKFILVLLAILLMLTVVVCGVFVFDYFKPHWNLQTDNAPWSPRVEFSSAAMPDGSIVVMGGLDSTGPQNDIWRSADLGKTWDLQTGHAPWSPRSGHSSIASSNGSIVLMGGMSKVNDQWVSRNDTWLSLDAGKTWTVLTDHASWTARSGHSADVMPDGSIVLMGGADDQSWIMRNDSWRSMDMGKTWTLQSDVPTTWSGREGQTSLVSPTGSILLIGGHQNYEDWNDSWSSVDMGRTWVLKEEHAPWPGRSGHSCVLMPDGCIVLMGGAEVSVNRYDNITGSSFVFHNDVWRLT